jgi:hypothetical protein
MDAADRSCIAVTEHPAFPLIGWAMHLGALDLRTKRPTPDTRTAEQVDMLEGLVESLYNSWWTAPGRQAVKHYLPAVAESGMTWAVLVGSILAADPRHCDTEAIEKFAPQKWRDEMAWRRSIYTRGH